MLNRDSVIELIRLDISAQQCYYYGSPNITEIPGKGLPVWQITFSECNGVVSGMKQHYVIVERAQGDNFQITGHSSEADDIWIARRAQISTDTIRFTDKRYYILLRDTVVVANQPHGICFLTDSLMFSQHSSIPICADDFGFTATGNIYCAIFNFSSDSAVAIKNITAELTTTQIEGAELVFGGFLCLHPLDSPKPELKSDEFLWSVPDLHFISTESVKADVDLKTYYNYGDSCWVAVTTISFNFNTNLISVQREIRKPRN